VDELANRRQEGFLLLLLLQEGLTLVEVLPPPAEGDPVVSLISGEDLGDDFGVLDGELFRLGFFLLLQFHPVVEGGAEEVEDELRALGDGLLVEFVGEDLVEVVGVELIVLVAVPQPDLGLHALHVLLLGHCRLLRPPALQLQYIMTHLFISLQIIPNHSV
jgi:hypothetical protein